MNDSRVLCENSAKYSVKRIRTAVPFTQLFPMIRLPDGIVTVHLKDERYRGAYYYRDNELVVTAYGLHESSVDMAVLGGERGKAVLKLAQLVLTDMVKDVIDMPGSDLTLSLQGSTTASCL